MLTHSSALCRQVDVEKFGKNNGEAQHTPTNHLTIFLSHTGSAQSRANVIGKYKSRPEQVAGKGQIYKGKCRKRDLMRVYVLPQNELTAANQQVDRFRNEYKVAHKRQCRLQIRVKSFSLSKRNKHCY